MSRSGSYRLARWDGSQRHALIDWKDDISVHQGLGATNRLGVEMDGRTIRVLVNGKALGSWQAAADLTGYVGFYVAQQGMEVVFNNLRITELAAR